MTEYRFASDEHRAEIIDFINYVFSQSARPHNFKTLIPKVYADGRDTAGIHAIALEDDRVRGAVAQHEINICYAGEKLKIGYIGSVSTYPYTRGSGHMKALMNMQIERAKERGVDIMMLGGQRQRYEYFGFSPVGSVIEYGANTSNSRHALKNVDISGIEFVDIKSAECGQTDAAHAIYTQKIVNGARSREDFEIILNTWNAETHIILKSGSVVGYINSDGANIFELALKDTSNAPAAVKAWLEKTGAKHISISVPTFETKLNRELAAFCEDYEQHTCEHVRIVNLKRTLAACLKLKQATEGLSDGVLTLNMDGGESVKVNVENGNIEVSETDEAPMVSLNRLDMQQYLFSANKFTYPENLPRTGWLPLPIYLDRADQF